MIDRWVKSGRLLVNRNVQPHLVDVGGETQVTELANERDALTDQVAGLTGTVEKPAAELE